MSNASTDLTLDGIKDMVIMIARRYGVPYGAITVGDLTKNTCILHGLQFRAYAVRQTWAKDFCYPCFSRAIASGERLRIGSGQSHGVTGHKSHWAQG